MISYFKLKEDWNALVKSKEASYKKFKDSKSFKNLEISLHNASWCPDCEREVTDLLAWLTTLNDETISFLAYEYEDKEKYKREKKENLLSINSLPTIIFKKDNKEIMRIEEESRIDFLNEVSILEKLIGDVNE